MKHQTMLRLSTQLDNEITRYAKRLGVPKNAVLVMALFHFSACYGHYFEGRARTRKQLLEMIEAELDAILEKAKSLV